MFSGMKNKFKKSQNNKSKFSQLVLLASAGAMLSGPLAYAEHEAGRSTDRLSKPIDSLNRRPDTEPHKRTGVWSPANSKQGNAAFPNNGAVSFDEQNEPQVIINESSTGGKVRAESGVKSYDRTEIRTDSTTTTNVERTGSEHREPAGALVTTSVYNENFDYDADVDAQADRILRLYGRGKMAGELVDHEYRQPGGQTLYPHFQSELPASDPNGELTAAAFRTSESMQLARNGKIIDEAAGAEVRPGSRTASKTHRSETSSSRTYSSPEHGSSLTNHRVVRGSEMIGMNVRGSNDERIGEIKDVVLDLESGRVLYTVVSAGGFQGAGDKLFAVPGSAFTHHTDKNTLVLNVDKDRLATAPVFNKENLNNADEAYINNVYQFYGQKPTWKKDDSASGTTLRDPSGAESISADRTSPSNSLYHNSDASKPQTGGVNNQSKNGSRTEEIKDSSGAQIQPPADPNATPAAVTSHDLGGVNNQSKDGSRLDPAQSQAGSSLNRNDAAGSSSISGKNQNSIGNPTNSIVVPATPVAK